jgi:glycosyltransferase involved in cell wall biosynthesis
MIPGLSVVICAIEDRGVVRAIESVLASAGRAGLGVEVVLVWQSAAAPPALPPGVRVARAFHAGLSYARNCGVLASTADRIAFVDDDELVAESWAAAVVAGFEEGADAVTGPILPASDEGMMQGSAADDTLRWHDDERTPPWTIGHGGNCAITRARLLALGGFDVRLGPGAFGQAADDTDLFLRLVRAGGRVRWRPDMAVRHPTSTAEQCLASRRRYGFATGRLARRHQSPRLAWQHGVSTFRAAHGAIASRSPRLARELASNLAGFLAGAATRDDWTSPPRLLERLPAAIRDRIGDRPLTAWPVPYRPRPHFLWGTGRDLVLHAYANPPAGWPAGKRARVAATAASSRVDVPGLSALVIEDDVGWVLENRLQGLAPRRAGRWMDALAEWTVDLARHHGPPCRTCAWWQEARAMRPAGSKARDAFDRIADLPAVVVHGDLQMKNVVVDRTGRIGVVDWEHAVAHGPPGFDLLFLAVMSRAAAGRAGAAQAVARGCDPPGVAVMARLRRTGLTVDAVGAAVRVAACLWADAERTRNGALGGVPPQREMASLAASLG